MAIVICKKERDAKEADVSRTHKRQDFCQDRTVLTVGIGSGIGSKIIVVDNHFTYLLNLRAVSIAAWRSSSVG